MIISRIIIQNIRNVLFLFLIYIFQQLQFKSQKYSCFVVLAKTPRCRNSSHLTEHLGWFGTPDCLHQSVGVSFSSSLHHTEKNNTWHHHIDTRIIVANNRGCCCLVCDQLPTAKYSIPTSLAPFTSRHYTIPGLTYACQHKIFQK